MKEIVVISGKGGTGKTSLTGAFAFIAGKEVVLADCDVDAADMHLIMEPDFGMTTDFFSGQKAIIQEDKCTGCGNCAAVCRFDAIHVSNGIYRIKTEQCEGCGYCSRVCPEKAIENVVPLSGQIFTSRIKSNSWMIHAMLAIAADNSGKLVSRVKNEARELARSTKTRLILVDGSPGIGCPVISSLSGASYVVLVTEPTVSAVHDLSRIIRLIKNFRLKAGCIINKSDLNPEMNQKVKMILEASDVDLITEIKYNRLFSEAISEGKTIIEMNNPEINRNLRGSWSRILSNMNS